MNIGFMYFPVYHETGTEDQYRLVLEIRDVDGYRPPRTSLIYKLDGTLSAYVEDYYGFTKLSIEDYLEWYSKLKGINYSALRYFNAAGYDIEGEISGLEQNPANLIPVVMETACGIRKQMSVFGDDYDTPDGTCIRDYVHVTDLADAHVKALDYIAKNNANLKLNLGSEVGTSVKEVIDIARKITGKNIDAKIVERRPGDPSELYATSKQALEILGWKAKYSDMETIIKTTWDAYLKNM